MRRLQEFDSASPVTTRLMLRLVLSHSLTKLGMGGLDVLCHHLTYISPGLHIICYDVIIKGKQASVAYLPLLCTIEFRVRFSVPAFGFPVKVCFRRFSSGLTVSRLKYWASS